MSSFKKIIIMLFALFVMVVVAACSATPETPAVPPTETRSPFMPPTSVPMGDEKLQVPTLVGPTLEGKLDVGDPDPEHQLRYRCYGNGSPTVIVEAGAGDKPTLTSSWNAVTLGVSSTTRMCIYDRVDVATSEKIAQNLHLLLTSAQIPGPYILVAHSLGGWHARVFTHLYPKDVVGLILVDTTPLYPDAWKMYATAYPSQVANESPSITANRMPAESLEAGLPPSQDSLDMSTSNRQVRDAGSFGDLPLVVISRTAGPNDFSRFDPSDQPKMAAIIQKIQKDMTNLSSNGTFIQASTTQQLVSEYQPEIIISAILKMVADIRK